MRTYVRTDGRTDRHDESTSAFRAYMKNQKLSLQCSLPVITIVILFFTHLRLRHA